METVKAKIFSKKLWMVCAEKARDNGIIKQQDIDNACDVWVDALDGKTEEEINELDKMWHINDAWFE